MTSVFSRRDFLRLAGMLPLTLAAPRWTRKLAGPGGQQNIIVVVFDAMSALNLSLYGYARQTMPNMARLAKRAIVYHDHFAGSSFTTPGTASLLTGTYPWSHRGILRNGEVAQSYIHRTAFDVFDDYYRIAYAHNPLAYTLLHQFRDDINELIEVEKLLLKSYDSFLIDLFKNDDDISNVGWVRDAKLLDGYAYSLFFSHLDAVLQEQQKAQLAREFPAGEAPWLGGQFFLLEQAIDWIAQAVTAISRPFLGYFHFLPPHAPYHPPTEFSGRFARDGYSPVVKPKDEFAVPGNQAKVRGTRRSDYDEFILYVDRQFGRLYDQLEKSGLLDSTWLVFTSDHGEMFERGIFGHNTDALYQPVVRVPLVIFEPGRQQGMDILTPTSAVDLLPTLAHVTGHAPPPWTEGLLLPPFASAAPDPNRNLYALRATRNDPAAPLTNASTMLVKGRYKLVYYFGFSDLGIPDHAKLFDLEADPEELTDLYSVEKDVAASLFNELKAKLNEVNKPFEN